MSDFKWERDFLPEWEKHKIGFISAGVLLLTIALVLAIIAIVKHRRKKQYERLNAEVLQFLNLRKWEYFEYDCHVQLRSSRAVNDYTLPKYFMEDKDRLKKADQVLRDKQHYAELLTCFLSNNVYQTRPMYPKLEEFIKNNLRNLSTFRVRIVYSSPTGRSTNSKAIAISRENVDYYKLNPTLLMSKTEYNKYVKEKNQALLDNKHRAYYDMVNGIIDTANAHRDSLVIKGDQEALDRLISSLFEKTVNSIKKIKSLDSEEWDIIAKVIRGVESDVNKITDRNQRIIDYYDSPEFYKIKMTCDSLMSSQREFNEYINEKAQSIAALFGSRVVRNETVNDDEYNYIRPYKKSVTPFTAEVSASVFASAENNPLDYIVKYFYPAKEFYPDQIQKLQFLVEELETLKEAKQIIETYKKDYQQYITDVPGFVLENDEDGFYSRLGFADISESALTVEYCFAYTSGGGMARRSFSVPMTEETIVDLIKLLQSKLTMTAFAKEQRVLMTSKLRQHIKERDDYTCVICKNSTHKEPNLLLEIDHIIPVSKGGYTVEDNLQTLCWKCNRSKSNKILE